MGLESPLAVLYNAEGNEIALSQSQTIPVATQPGLMMLGSGTDGRAYFFRASTDGAIFITGSIQTSAAVSSSVIIGGWAANTTASLKLDAWATTVTGAVSLVPSASMIVGGFASGISASVVLGGWATAATASVRQIGSATTSVSSALASVTNFTILTSSVNRQAASFYKEGTNICYIKLGSTATATSFTVKLSQNGFYEIPQYYTGQVDIIFSTAVAGNTVYVTEVRTP